MAKTRKAGAVKYDLKMAIDGTFADVIKVSVNYTPRDSKVKKTAKKKK